MSTRAELADLYALISYVDAKYIREVRRRHKAQDKRRECNTLGMY